MKGSKRVISLIMALVMAISLCSGVWAENGSNNEENRKTQSDEGLAFKAKNEETQAESRQLYFFNGIDDGYMTYYENASLSSVANGKIPAIVSPPLTYDADNGQNTQSVFVAFKNDGTITNDTAVTVNRNDAGIRVTYITTDDASLCVYQLTATKNLGQGENSDTVDLTFHDSGNSDHQFAIIFRNSGNNEGNQQGEPFGGMKAALSSDNTAALAYVDLYLVDSTGYVKNGNSDTTGLAVKDSYSDTEKTAIRAAVAAFRAMSWQWRDSLSNVGGIQIENDWYDCFGRYLAELASRIGISLWGDYPSWNGVKMALDSSCEITFYSSSAYGIPAYDDSLNVTADSADKSFTIPYTQPEYCFTIPAGSKEVTSLTVKGAVSTERTDNEGNVIGYSAPLGSTSITVNTQHDGWFGDDNDRTYIFSVWVSSGYVAYDLPLVITFNDNTTKEFTVKAVEPLCDWTFVDGSKPANASDLLNVFYK